MAGWNFDKKMKEVRVSVQGVKDGQKARLRIDGNCPLTATGIAELAAKVGAAASIKGAEDKRMSKSGTLTGKDASDAVKEVLEAPIVTGE